VRTNSDYTIGVYGARRATAVTSVISVDDNLCCHSLETLSAASRDSLSGFFWSVDLSRIRPRL